MPESDPMTTAALFTTHRPSVGVLIRFSNSGETLPEVLAALRRQTLWPDAILGVDSGSQDLSRQLIEAAGGTVLRWPHAYEHSRVLNFGLRHLDTDLVLILSSHTVLEDATTLARMVEAMRDPLTACVSLKWDHDPYYSDSITWQELMAKGLKFGSIYSNSMGMIRRHFWMREAFDESLPTAEDYAWAISQVKSGHVCRRLALPFRYKRSGHARDYEFASIVFQFAREHRLKVAWLGVKNSIKAWWSAARTHHGAASMHRARLKAWFHDRWLRLRRAPVSKALAARAPSLTAGSQARDAFA
jgi:glycosyltransferase involved in cell wall biosynthesis